MMQKRKVEVAESGNASSLAYDWLAQIADWTGISAAAATIMEDSVQNNALLSPHDSSDAVHDSMVLNGSLIPIPQAERMTSVYGSFAPISVPTEGETSKKKLSLGAITELESPSESWPTASIDSDSKSRPLMTRESIVSLLFLTLSQQCIRPHRSIMPNNPPFHNQINRTRWKKTRYDSLHRADARKNGASFASLLEDWDLTF
jgi:hypothetical protein